MGSLEQSIRRHLVDYLAGKESYDDFVDWMYGVIANIDQRGDQGASSLGYSIMLAIAEFDNDDLSLDDFRDTLRDLVQPTSVRVAFRAPNAQLPSSRTSSFAPAQRRTIRDYRHNWQQPESLPHRWVRPQREVVLA